MAIISWSTDSRVMASKMPTVAAIGRVNTSR